MTTPFEINSFGKETINPVVFCNDENGIDTVTNLLGIMITFGKKRTETAIKNTFPVDECTRIFSIINTILSL